MDINELRDEVARRQQAANRKVQRLNRKGVSLSGTTFDVRREPSNIGRYTRKQLSTYLNQLNSFVDRRNAFVSGVEGVPIRKASWDAYKRTERAYLKRVEQHYSGVKDTFIPAAGKTVQGFDKTMRRTRTPGMGGVPRPLEALPELQPFEVMDEKKLARLQRRLEGKLDKGFLPKELKKQRRQMNRAVAEFGDPELVKLAKGLSDTQLDTLWNYTDAPRDLFAGYHFMQLLSANKADEAQASIHEDSAAETRQWLEWAATLEPRQNRKNRR